MNKFNITITVPVYHFFNFGNLISFHNYNIIFVNTVWNVYYMYNDYDLGNCDHDSLLL